MIKVISLINHKGGVRLQMVCGKRALAHFDKVDEANREIGKIFSAKPYETAEAAAHFAEEQIRLREKINELNKKYMKARAELLPSEKICILAEEGMTMMEIRKFCEYLLKEEKGEICAVLSPKDENGYNYAIGSNSVNLRNKLKDWNEKLHGKGGGKPEMVQGSFSSDLETIKSVLSEKE